FPARLMKEGEPAEHFHIQEERRLFYVALTRAQERLTLTTVTEARGKVPVFVEDILLDPAVRRRDVRLMTKLPPVRQRAAARAGSAPTKDRKSTRLNSSHVAISYAVFCL